MRRIIKSVQPVELFEVSDGAEVALTYSVNPKLSCLRTNLQSDKRSFFIEHRGLVRNNVVLRNEYGHLIGRLRYGKGSHDSGILTIENTSFNFRVEPGDEPRLVIFTEEAGKPILSCGFRETTNQPKTSRVSPDLEYLVFALGWYLFRPLAR